MREKVIKSGRDDINQRERERDLKTERERDQKTKRR